MEQYKHSDNPFYKDIYSDTNTFKISGTPLEVIQALAWVRALGGGHVRIGLNTLNAKALYYTGVSAPEEFKGRLNQEDLEIIRELTQHQKWVKSVEPWAGEIVTHDLDKIDYTRDKDNVFNMHPMDRFGKVLKVHWTQWQRARMNSWLDIPANVGRPQGKAIVFCGSGWEPREGYANWRTNGIERVATFVGNQADYDRFCQVTGLSPALHLTDSVYELATWISGTQQVIGTPGWGIAIAQALNKVYSVQKVRNLDVWNDPWILQERGNNSAF
jgi:hypothetical protein